MKKHLLLFSLLFCSLYVFSQDTFSIVAVDSSTGEVGAAGASCIDDNDCGGCGGVIIISDLIPGRGGMNSQAYACIPNVNLNNGITRLNAGDSPQQAMQFVIDNDACGVFNNTYRQYGLADLDSDTGEPRTAAYTGINCDGYANHITGPNYAIQGNILLGQGILDSMEANFLNTQGTLAEKLMAALQGANVIGADTRCAPLGISSKSAFIRVAKPDDAAGDFWMDLNVPVVGAGVEPIDALQELFDDFILTNNQEVFATEKIFDLFPNPAYGQVFLQLEQWEPGSYVVVYDMTGKVVYRSVIQSNQMTISKKDLQGSGTFVCSVFNQQDEARGSQKFILLD